MISSVPVDPSPSGPIRLKVYGVEKTLVDCFRHRRRLGMEPVLKALKDAGLPESYPASALASRTPPSASIPLMS
jgi:predicted transcriptional regulator of viral defense system